MRKLIVLLFLAGGLIHAEEYRAAARGIAKLQAKVKALGFEAVPAPFPMTDESTPALDGNRRADLPNFSLVYMAKKQESLPETLACTLSATEASEVAQLMGKKSFQPGSNANYQLKASGISLLHLLDIRYHPAGGAKLKISKSLRLATTALTAKELVLLSSSSDSRSSTIATQKNLLLGGRFQPLSVKTRKKVVRLTTDKEKKRMARLKLKKKQGGAKEVLLALPVPGSGEDPSTLVVTVGRNQGTFDIVPLNPQEVSRLDRKPTRWGFRSRNRSLQRSISIPSQFDGKSAFVVSLTVKAHKKKPFRPRDREVSLEVFLLHISFGK